MFSGATINVELTPLCAAVWDNNIRHVEYLLRAGHDVNEKMKLDGRTALFVAVHFNHRHIAALLIHHGAKVNERDKEGMTPLHLACHFRDRDMVKLLLNNKADVHAQTSIKATPILAAANISNVSPAGTDVMGDPYDVLSLLIEHGANVDDCLEDCQVGALHYAVRVNNVRLVKLLIKAKVNVNVKLGEKPLLFVAINSNFIEIVQAFLKVEALDVDIRDENLNTLLHRACFEDNLPIVKLLVKRKFDVNAKNKALITPLMLTLGLGSFGVVKYLLEQDSTDVNLGMKEEINLPLSIAIVIGNSPMVLSSGARPKIVTEVMKTIINKTENINVVDRDNMMTPLLYAAKFQDLESFKCLIQKGANVNLTESQKVFTRSSKRGLKLKSALHYACEHKNNVEMVKLLLSHGADVNDASNAQNHKPIAIAIQTGDPQIVKELQNHGAQIDKEIYSKNKAAARIAHSALELEERKAINDLLRLNLDFLKNVRSNKYDEVKKNIEDGACINVSSERCGSALIYAAWKGYEEIVDLLLDNGADVNFKSATGFTALHMACRFHDDDSIVRKLLRHGAYYNVVDGKTGKTPLLHAGKGAREVNTVLLYFIHEIFKLMANNDTTILDRLDEMKSLILEGTKKFGPGDYNNFSLLKVAKNDAGETILDIAKKRGFPLLEELEKKLAEL
ncbi:hypothetical protein M8J77_025556 [Diaphorina citri]|nr:hypothetical protein M8J77_025556 [Diaphorina citri]